MLGKKTLTVLVLLVAVGVGFFLFQERCKQAPEGPSQMIQLQCLGSLQENADDITAEVCEKLNRGFDCELNELTESDIEVIKKIVRVRWESCVKDTFKQNNYCTDNINYIF